MGWTSYHATHYRKGTVDRKAECDAYFMEGLNAGGYEVLKSSLVGSVYYAAVRRIAHYNYDTKEYTPLPVKEHITFGVVMLTSVNMKDYYNFAYKDIDETMGPSERKCPMSIIRLLSPTDHEWANEWRNDCIANAKKKSDNKLSSLPIGTVIVYTRRTPDGEEQVELVKHPPAYGKKQSFWKFTNAFKYMPKTRIPNDFRIIRFGTEITNETT